MTKPGPKKGQTHTGQFQKGKSGNPSGRPVTKPWSDALRKVAEAVATGEKISNLDKLAAKTFQLALEGDTDARQEIAHRLEGRVPQNLGVLPPGAEGEGGVGVSGTVTVVHTFTSPL